MNAKTDKDKTEKAHSKDAQQTKLENSDSVKFSKNIAIKTTRKLKARHNPTSVIWFGLGMMGVIGWSIVVPTLLGAALGIWLDGFYTDQYSWTLALLVAGLTFGCLNAWYWVDKEQRAMHDKQEHRDE